MRVRFKNTPNTHFFACFWGNSGGRHCVSNLVKEHSSCCLNSLSCTRFLNEDYLAKMCGDNSKISGIVAHKRIVPNTPSFFLTDSATKEIIIGTNCTDCNRGKVVVEPSIDETKVSEKKMWVENQKKRFKITPVTAAETIESVYSNLGCCVIQST